MQVEFWSDIICPWCGLTDHRLSAVIDQFEHGAGVEVIHRSFPLHPELPVEGITQRELARRHGIRGEDIERVLKPIEKYAKSEGLQPYSALERTLGPTDLLHELLAYASDQGLHAQAWRTAFRVHFGNGENLWSLEQVVAFGNTLGLDETEMRHVLTTRKYRERVQADQKAALDLGSAGTPFILIDGRVPVAGARETAVLVQALRTAWESRPEAAPTDPADGAMCLPGDIVCLPEGVKSA